MSRPLFFRKWISFLKAARPRTDLLGLLAALMLFVLFSPPEIFNSNPATGGDTGSHFWPLVTLVEQGLPHWSIRVWNPGNLGGEPHLTHYFPLPYLLMALLSVVMPLGKAFNIGTWLPVFLFPLCVYFCFRGLRARFPIPLLASLFSLSFLYNESFSMWGGNFLSTLAGQFAHVYAHDFFLLGVGALAWEMSRKKFPWLSLFLFAGVLLSHFYVALYLPPVFLAFLLWHPQGTLKERFFTLVKVGSGALLLSAWFVIPMLHNARWNTAFGLEWGGANLMREVFPRLFWPMGVGLVVLAALSVVISSRRHWLEREWKLIPALFALIMFFGVAYYFIFPPLGLVDVRALPTLQMVLCFGAAFFLGLFLNQVFAQVWVWFVTVALVGILIWWPARQVVNLPHWMKWNYSSWNAKNTYPELMELSQKLKGDFSQGRVIYENSQLSNSAGTMRVFEMLPYFSGRATLESVYMQATVLAPATFYMQALISKSPSCPFPNYSCTKYELQRLPDYLKLMGIADLILITPEVMEQANQAPFLEFVDRYDIWNLYHSKLDAPLVEVVQMPVSLSQSADFKREFYDWFLKYDREKPFLVQASKEDFDRIQSSIKTGECHPELKVQFNQLHLQTDCPGRFHLLKFAYHSTFEASSGDRLYLTSPGFIGLIPSQKEVTLTWGQHWLWTLANAISWSTLLVLLTLLSRSWWRRRKQ